MSTAGEHAAVKVDEIAASLPSRVFKPGALTIAVSVAVGMSLAGAGLAFAQSGVKTTVDAGVAPVREEVRTLRADFEANKKDVGDALRRLSDDNHETQLDVRELYRVIRDGRRSERLEAPPVTDGGR